jgi:hypothetical protein
VATWRITYRPAWAASGVYLIWDVEADEVYDDGRTVTLYGHALVMDRPRQVIALRVDKRVLAGKPFRLCDVHARWGGVRL